MAIESLTVVGVLIDERTLDLAPGFLTSQPPTDGPVGGESSPDALIVECLASRGEVIHREVLPTAPVCFYRSLSPPAPRLVSGLVQFVAGTRTLRFLYRGEALREVHVAEESPVVSLLWRPTADVAGVQVLEWKASHPGRAALAYMVLYARAQEEWQAVSLILRDNVASVDFDGLPGGEECRIRVLATDGVNTTSVDSPVFRVARKGLEPLILEPDDGAVVSAGLPVLVQGVAIKWEDQSDIATALRWRSSLDGDLGEGRMLDVTLSPGLHEITLTVGEGADVHKASAQVTAQPASS